MRPSRTARTSPKPGGVGGEAKAVSIRRDWFFIDESAAKTNLTRLRVRLPRGWRLVCHSTHGHWRTTTMISSVCLEGTTACLTINEANDNEVFHAYVSEVLVP